MGQFNPSGRDDGAARYQPLFGEDSPFSLQPENLRREDAQLLAGIRHQGQALADAWERLHALMLSISFGQPSTPNQESKLLVDAWHVVVAFNAIRSTADKLQGPGSPTLSPFAQAFRALRNDDQHRDERLKLAKYANMPPYGTLTWTFMHSHDVGTLYSVWTGARSGMSTSDLNPLNYQPSGLGMQSVTLESFSGSAPLDDGVRAVLRFVRKLEFQLRAQWEHVETMTPSINTVFKVRFGLEPTT